MLSTNIKKNRAIQNYYITQFYINETLLFLSAIAFYIYNHNLWRIKYMRQTSYHKYGYQEYSPCMLTMMAYGSLKYNFR